MGKVHYLKITKEMVSDALKQIPPMLPRTKISICSTTLTHKAMESIGKTLQKKGFETHFDSDLEGFGTCLVAKRTSNI